MVNAQNIVQLLIKIINVETDIKMNMNNAIIEQVTECLEIVVQKCVQTILQQCQTVETE
jgi:hypothetical protein